MVMVINWFFKRITWFVDVIIYDGHLTAISAACMSFLPVILIKLPVSKIITIIPFVACEIIYSFNRYKERFHDDSGIRNSGLLKRKKFFIPFFIFLSLLFIGYLIWFKNLLLLIFSCVITIMGVFYSIFIKKLTKLIPGIKNFFVAFCWASITILPFTFYNNLLLSYFSALIIFSFVFISVLLFEIFLDFRDIKEDKKRSLITFPIVLKKSSLAFLLLFINFFSIIPIFLGFYFNFLPKTVSILLLSFFYNLIFITIIAGKINVGKKFFEPLVDCGKILWIIEVIFFSNLLL